LKSFYAFWEFLLSADLQKEWDELTGALYETLENRGIDALLEIAKQLLSQFIQAIVSWFYLVVLIHLDLFAHLWIGW